ncbi:MAG: hypothetical protein FWF77_09620 [Defluviitaleaceae bacterium]|nr:hypothetical protein [Defluviitaleaceae bacterium]
MIHFSNEAREGEGDAEHHCCMRDIKHPRIQNERPLEIFVKPSKYEIRSRTRNRCREQGDYIGKNRIKNANRKCLRLSVCCEYHDYCAESVARQRSNRHERNQSKGQKNGNRHRQDCQRNFNFLEANFTYVGKNNIHDGCFYQNQHGHKSASVGACRRTIFYDLDALTLDYNIETYPGRGGGVRLVQEKNIYKGHLSNADQEAILEAVLFVDKPLAERLVKIVMIHGSYRNKKQIDEALDGKVG